MTIDEHFQVLRASLEAVIENCDDITWTHEMGVPEVLYQLQELESAVLWYRLHTGRLVKAAETLALALKDFEDDLQGGKDTVSQ